jgi:hydrogenase/urease accessory protein HupE
MRILFVALMAMLAALCAAWHPANVASARAKVGVDGVVDLRIRFDILAYILDEKPSDVADAQMKELIDQPSASLDTLLKDAEARFRRGLRVVGDNGDGALDSFTFPSAADVQDWVRQNGRDNLPMMLTVTAKGHFAKGARTSAFRFPPVLDTVILTTEFPYQEPISEPVDSDSVSRPQTIPTDREVAAAKAAIAAPRTAAPAATQPPAVQTSAVQPPMAHPPEGRASAKAPGVPGEEQAKEPPQPSVWQALAERAANPPTPSGRVGAPAEKPAPLLAKPAPVPPVAVTEPPAAPVPKGTPAAWYEGLPSYVKMGFVHILPHGLDHILFVLGLFLLSSRTKDLLKQVTAFTVAHSLTLGLALYGVVRLPAGVVEPLIAASIAFVAIENVFTTQMKSWRVFVVFGFGLVHGLGFAGALRDLGLQRANFLGALLGFNAGVELGQLTVVLAAFLAVGWFRSHARYRSWVAVPASVAIGAVALFWTVQRLL